jgi:phosphohistidine swiveling domain-containing protein
VVERLMHALGGQPRYVPDIVDTGQSKILVAHDLSPADVLQFKQHQFASFLTELGGTTSHTAVVARSLNLPSVASLHYARSLIYENDTLIVDGTQGVVIVDPDPQVLADYRLRQHQNEIDRKKLRRLRTTRAMTLDGTGVELHANIELPDDVAEAEENGASGIGLFRTEFLFMNRDTLPNEEEQFEAYRQVVQSMHGLPVTIRTYDLGSDKNIDGADRSTLQNPALGLRAIRLCLTEPRRFQIQLRAILRASHYGNTPTRPTARSTPTRSNAVLVCHALNASHHVAGGYDDGASAGGTTWSARASRWTPNASSSSASTTPARASAPPGRCTSTRHRPRLGRRLPGGDGGGLGRRAGAADERLGIDAAGAVIGGSLGGMQALAWTLRYPARLRHCIAVATAPNLSAQNIAFNEVARRAIVTDPDFHGGHFYATAWCPGAGCAWRA